MGKSLQQAVADAYTRQKEDKQRQLTEREKQCKRLEPVAIRIGVVLLHDDLRTIGTFGTEQSGIGFRYALPSCTTDSVLIEAFEDRVVLKRGRCGGTVIPIGELYDDVLVEAVAHMMTECHISNESIRAVLDKHKIKQGEVHASL